MNERSESGIDEGFVNCDEDCRAKLVPVTPIEFVEAYRHWKEHSVEMGCSHGC